MPKLIYKAFPFLIVLAIFYSDIHAAEFEVKSFEKDPNDLAARKYERTDINGNTCALVKVKTDIQGLNFESGYGIVGDVMFKEGQYWVYLSPKEQRLSIFKTGFVRLDYEIPYPVQSYDVFHMILTKKGSEVNALPVTFQVTPEDAQLTVDGESIPNNEPLKLKIGTHQFRAERENYQSLQKTIKVDEQNVLFEYEMEKIEDVAVQISSEPSGAKVEMDGVLLGETPLSTFYPSGKYPINVEKDGYLPVEDELKVKAPETTQHYQLEENVGYLTVKTSPEATVTFNGEEVEANQPVKLIPKVVDVNVTMPKAKTLEETVVIKRNDDKTIELMPDIQTGTIQVAPTPFDAKVKLKGDAGDLYEGEGSKVFSDIPVGTYQLKVQKEGYKTYEDEIKLKSNDKVTHDTKLEEEPPIDIEMVKVKGGCFDMGCTSEQTDCDDDEKPVHEVCVDDFYISKTEVTHAQYIKFMNEADVSSDGSKTDTEYIYMDDNECAIGYRGGEFYFKGSGKADDDQCPVIEVSWYGAKAFAEWAGGRLPTESEWEYAARGGNKSRSYKYAGSNRIDEVAWYDDNSGSETHPVGQKQPNELGLYDMSGNIWEWCSDWYDSDYYGDRRSDNPQGPSNGRGRVLRGGSRLNFDYACRVANRFSNLPNNSFSSYVNFGFRIAAQYK